MADAGWRLPDCPRCGMSDMSQATAAIVAGQTHVMHGSQRAMGAAWTPAGLVPVAMGASFDSTQQSELARMLDLPAPRPVSSTAGCLAVVLLVPGVLMSGFGVWAVMTNESEPTSAASSAEEAPDALTAAIGGFLMGGLPLIVGSILALTSRQARRRRRRYIDGWQRAAPVAARLVYCGRDHIVYDPAAPDVCLHPTQTAAYAYGLSR